MATRKSPSSKKPAPKPRKRKSSRKKHKVVLSGGTVLGLTMTLAVACASFLAYSFFTRAQEPYVLGVAESSRDAEIKSGQTKEDSSKKSSGAGEEQRHTASPRNKNDGPEVSGKSGESHKTQEPPGQSVSAAQGESKDKSQRPSVKENASSKNNGTASSNGASSGSAQKSAGTADKGASQNAQSGTTQRLASAGGTSASGPGIQELPPKYSIPQAVSKAKLCFVIDDAGANVANVKRYTSLPFPITIAVLPRLAHSKDCAYVVRSSGKELILHQPMLGSVPNPGPGAILPDMSTSEIASIIKKNLDEIGPGVKGFNNHEGSIITADSIKAGAVLEVAMERGIYFLDSRTALAEKNKVRQAALERDMTYLARYAPFLDNDISRDAMLRELYKGLDVANKNGYAIIIGHVDKSVKILPDLLQDIYPYLKNAGYEITTPSKLKL